MLKFQIMFDSYQLYLFFITSVLLALTPGPDILTVVARGISQGRKPALVAAAGFSLGCLNHTVVLVLGMAALLKASPTAFSVIKYLGGAYLVYIGIQMIRHRRRMLAPRANMEANLKKCPAMTPIPLTAFCTACLLRPLPWLPPIQSSSLWSLAPPLITARHCGPSAPACAAVIRLYRKCWMF